MADPTHPAHPTGSTVPSACDRLADDLELYGLGALDPCEQQRVAEHLAACATCRARLEEVERLLGELLAAVPPVEPPPELTRRALATVGAPTPPPAAAPGAVGALGAEPPPVSSGRSAPGPTRPRRVALVAACAVLVVAVAAGLWLARSRDTDPVAVPTTATVVREAPLVTADGATIGTVSLTGGAAADLTMTVDRAPAGVAYDCVVVSADGVVATVGSWTTAGAGPATWSTPIDPSLGPVDEVRLVVPGTGTVATARPA